MKNKILLIILLFILIILTIYFYIYKIKENFLNSNDYSFLGLNSDNKLTFYNKLDNLYYSTQKDNNITITNFLYNNKMLIVLDSSNNISYCTECNFTEEYSLTPIILDNNFTNNTINPIKNIAFDKEVGNNLFILLNNKNTNDLNYFYILKNFNTVRNMIKIQMPVGENYFIDFDAKYGKLVGIGNKTNFIYQTDINKTNLDDNFIKTNWNILDKNQNLINIKITLYGYIGQYSNGKFYLCNQFNNYKWTEIKDLPENSTINNIEETSSQGISFTINIDNNIFLYIYDESNGKFIQITTVDDNNKLHQTKVIDYIYPVITTVPELNPLDTAGMVANSDNIKNESDKYQQMIKLLNNIDTNIKTYYTNQLNFNNQELNTKINTRNQNIIQFKKDIGEKEPFEDIDFDNIDFNKINKKLKPQPTILIDGKKVKKARGEDLIIDY